ncbi:transporter substrate-binding domain-containing protein [bacterium]|nr:transporter substrate-binding domain-containing protein [bacterium]
MKTTRVKLMTLLILLFSLELFSATDTLKEIQKRSKLRVGLDVGYMPFEMADKKNNIIGFDIDLAKLMAREMGVKLEIVNTEWDGIIPALLTNKFDMVIAGMTITTKRNMKINFSDPYVTIGQTVLIKKSLKGVIKSYRDLNNPKYKVSSKLGTTGEQAIKKYLPKAKYKAYQTSQDAAMEVVNGRIDAFVYDLPFNIIFNASKGQGKLHFLKKTFTHEPLAIAVRQDDPNILNFLNNFLAQIKADGRYDRMYKKWFEKTDWLKNVK